MSYAAVFRRYEMKYMLGPRQHSAVLEAMEGHMLPDSFAHSSIRNLYLDTENYRLIRRSVEKPLYKEKLRIRSYGCAREGEPVFVELKRKYKGLVYKRRLAMGEGEALRWLCGGGACPAQGQIAREIDYFISFYEPLQPRVFLSYERDAYRAADGSDLRITFDRDILSRRRDLSLVLEPGGESLLGEDRLLMEIKCSGGLPLWLCGVLSREGIFKSSFSKYGCAYEKTIYPEMKGKLSYV